MSQPAPSNPILQYYQDWSGRTPFVTRCSLIGMVLMYIFSFFIQADLILGNQAYFTVMHLEIYRLFLSPLVGNSIITIILIAVFFPSLGTRLEYSMGSSALIFLMGTLTLATNILFDAICLLLHFAGSPISLFWKCSGFWLILFGLIVIECMQAPDLPRRMFMIPIDIPSKYFPLIMYAIIMLMGGFQLDLAVAMLVGYLYSKGYLERMSPSLVFLERCETSGLLSYCSAGMGWIRCSGVSAAGTWGQEAHSSEEKEGLNSQPRTTLGGHANVHGVGSQSTTTTTETKNERKQDPFPGSGHKLTPAGSSGGSWMPSFSASGAGGSQSRESIAARRLAALQAGSSGGGSGVLKTVDGPSAPPAPISASAVDPGAVAQLMEMGYSHADSSRALAMAGGSLHGATQLLTT